MASAEAHRRPPLTSQLAEGGGEAAGEGPQLVVGQRDAVDALGDAPHGFVDAGGEGHQLAVGQVCPGESRVTAGGRCRPEAAKRHAHPPKKTSLRSPVRERGDGTRVFLTPSSRAGLSAAGGGFGEGAVTPFPSPSASGVYFWGTRRLVGRPLAPGGPRPYPGRPRGPPPPRSPSWPPWPPPRPSAAA